jgi:hypothetical protein
MSINRLYHTSLQQLQHYHPNERITRLRGLAWLMAGILLAKSVQLAHIALTIPGQATERSIVRRLERLLDNHALRVRPLYEPIARAWLLAQARSTGQIRLISDATKVSFSHRQLMVALAFRRRAIPIAWTWQPGAKGHCSARVQLALLASVRNLLPLNVSVVLVGDSEFEAVELQEQLDAWGWNYVLRQKPNNCLQSAAEHDWQAFGTLLERAGQYVWLESALLTRRHKRPVNLLAEWRIGEKEAWLLATNLPTRRAALQAYQRRMWIEELFGDLKGHGFDLEGSHLRQFARLSRLTLAVVLLYDWLVTSGVQVVKRGLRSQVDRHDRRDLSIFQIGLRWTCRCLKNARPFTIRFVPMGLQTVG